MNDSCIQLNGFKYSYRTRIIQFNISNLFELNYMVQKRHKIANVGYVVIETKR